MPSAQPSTTPWAHTDFEPTDPTIKSLAQHVITASGGGRIRIKHQDVRTHLTAWFNATIPDIFGASPFDYAAVDSQAPPNHVDDGRHVIRTTMVDPSVIVGITLVRECHPVIAPFSITAGPGVASVVFD